jgi:hypothetical protein
MKEKAEKNAEERRRVIADFMKHPENWERVGSTIERPASGKKFNTNSSQIKKRDYVIGQNLISSLEHSILGTLLNDESEPLHILYKDALSEFQNVNFASFIEALVNLFNLGYVETRIEDIGEPIKKLTKDGLISHYREVCQIES